MSGGNQSIPLSADDSPSVVLDLIYSLKIKDVMTKSLITARPGDSFRRVQNLMKENYITGIPITEGDALLGIVSMYDIICALDGGYIEEKVGKRMTRDVIVLEDDMPLSFGISYLNKYRFGRFPVLNKERKLVGIISSNDVIKTLLVAMNKEVLRLEKAATKVDEAEATPDGVTVMEFQTVRHDFETAGHASTEVKKALKKKNIDPALVRRVAVASYELEINQVVHSLGGVMSYRISDDKIIINATDVGPGIPNIDLALQEGWSTADEWIRSLGFGAGMGLANTKRVSDDFSITSEPGKGTTVISTIQFKGVEYDH